MALLITLGALLFLMLIAYRGYSVILFAPVAALGAVLLTDPSAVPPIFTGLFMEKMVGFVKLYLPVFILGAVFGKLIEISGFSRVIVASVIKLVGAQRAIFSIVCVCALLTYGGVSLFVVVFAVYPFAAEMFRQGNIPKRLIPGTIALGAFSFTMDALPGTPQIQNIIPTSFFKTNTWAAPWLGVIGGVFILTVGMFYLESRRRKAAKAGETYGEGHSNEPVVDASPSLSDSTTSAPSSAISGTTSSSVSVAKPTRTISPWLAVLPLIVVGVGNTVFTHLIQNYYGATHETFLPGMNAPLITQVPAITAIWAVEGALLLGIGTVIAFSFSTIAKKFAEGTKAAVAGALLASLNTAAEYGFGAVIAALPGFLLIRDALKSIPNPLINEAATVTTLAGVTGSASGGLSIALASMSEHFLAAANSAGIPPEVLHRVASMASGGMDTLPHNGAVITLLAVTGLTHRQAYGDIFAITCIKTTAVAVVIGVYYTTGIV